MRHMSLSFFHPQIYTSQSVREVEQRICVGKRAQTFFQLQSGTVTPCTCLDQITIHDDVQPKDAMTSTEGADRST